jgi:cysteinyl-tRNA synthetase
VVKDIGQVLFGNLYETELVPEPDVNTRLLVEFILAEREKLRHEKNFSQADALRKTLQKSGIEVSDTAHGPIWWSTKFFMARKT